MAVPRTKKKKKSNEELMGAIQELNKSILYLYLADVKSYNQKEIEDINLFFARTILMIRRGDITFETILDKLDEHHINLEEVGKKTDEFIDKYWEVWK